MGQSGSPSACRRRPERQGPDQGGLAGGGWEVGPGSISRREDPEIADLSRSFQDCSLRGPSLYRKAACSGLQGLHCGPKGSPPEGPLPFPHGRMVPGLLIDRSSLFRHNAGEKLEKFLSEKSRVWGRSSRRSWGPSVCREEPSPRPLQQGLPGKGGTPEGPLRGQGGGGKGLSAPGSSSAWILPQCRVGHLQRCRACQAFNQDQPPAPYEDRWGPQEEEGPSAVSVFHQNGRTPPTSKQETLRRVSKVQRWLEQTPGTEWPPGPEPQRELRPRGRSQSHPGGPGYASPGQRDRGLWATAGDAVDGRRKGPSEQAGTRRKGHPGEETQVQPAVWVLPCNDDGSDEEAGVSPCACSLCERQPPGATSVWDKARPDPSAGEVAQLLQAENRVSRIVEAFERRSLWEAKMAEQERAFEAARRRDA